MPTPGQLATEVQTKLHTLVTLTRAGIVHPERPDHLWHTARALLRYGTTPAAGYTAAARNYPDEPAVIDELGTLSFKEVDERTNALAHALKADGDRRGRRRRDHVPQPPRLDRRRGGVLEARRERAVHEHGVLGPAADRRRQAREAEGDRLRPRVRRGAGGRRQAAQALRRLARARGRQGQGPAAGGPDRARRHGAADAAGRAGPRDHPHLAARPARRRARRARCPRRSTRSPRCCR